MSGVNPKAEPATVPVIATLHAYVVAGNESFAFLTDSRRSELRPGRVRRMGCPAEKERKPLYHTLKHRPDGPKNRGDSAAKSGTSFPFLPGSEHGTL
jgi:hypothetical protein